MSTPPTAPRTSSRRTSRRSRRALRRRASARIRAARNRARAASSQPSSAAPRARPRPRGRRRHSPTRICRRARHTTPLSAYLPPPLHLSLSLSHPSPLLPFAAALPPLRAAPLDQVTWLRHVRRVRGRPRRPDDRSDGLLRGDQPERRGERRRFPPPSPPIHTSIRTSIPTPHPPSR